jgi:5-methylthioadenosine/S-adenosylhomocysteine deaminase
VASRVLIEHAVVWTGEPDPDHGGVPLLPDCPIAVEGDTILAVGDLPAGFCADEVIDATDCVALPGLFNAHCHSPMTLERGWAEDLPFDRWLNERIWVAESALEPEDVHWGAALAACEMIRAGVVGFADHYFWMDQVARVVEQSGMKALLAWCFFGIGKEHEVGGITFDTAREFTRRWHGAADGRIRTALGPHSPYMCPPAVLQQVAGAAGALDAKVHLHLAESDEQLQRSLERHGASPVAHVASLGLMDRPGLLAAHCISLADGDVELLARHRVCVAHTPKTYAKLAMRLTPVGALQRQGVTVALGTDGPASNGDLNMLEVLRLAGLLQKLEQRSAEVLPVAQLLRMGTHAGALALGFDRSGTIAPGAAADIAILDTRAPHWAPRHDVAAGVVYASHPADVRHLLVDGRLLLRNGELLTLDEERIYHEAERRAMRMVGTPKMTKLRSYEG